MAPPRFALLGRRRIDGRGSECSSDTLGIANAPTITDRRHRSIDLLLAGFGHHRDILLLGTVPNPKSEHPVVAAARSLDGILAVHGFEQAMANWIIVLFLEQRGDKVRQDDFLLGRSQI